MCSKSNDMCLCQRKTEGDLRHTEEKGDVKMERDWNDAISHRSQAFPIATRSWKKQGGSDSHQDPPEEP